MKSAKSSTGKPSPKNAAGYIQRQPRELQKKLQELRDFIRKEVPGAEEVISYGIIAYRYLYLLVGIGATKDHCSFYIMSNATAKAMKDELSGLTTSGTTLHFRPGQKLPKTILKKIIRARIKENELAAEARKK